MTDIFHDDFGSIPVSFTVTELPDNPDAQVASTVELMGRYVREDCTHPVIVQDAHNAMTLSGLSDPVESVFRYVKGKMRFQTDEVTAHSLNDLVANVASKPVVEVLVRPLDLALMSEWSTGGAVGDCDDFTMYAACLLCALGVECKFATVGADKSNPEAFSHVYCVAYPDGQRVPLDCSHGPYAGWEAPNLYGKFAEWNIQDREGLDGIAPFLIAGALLGLCLI